MVSDSMNTKLLFSAALLHGSMQSLGDTTSECGRLQEAYGEQHLLVQQQREIAHLQSLVNEQRCEIDREVALRARLQEAYDEQYILVQQQQELLAEVDQLYKEQAQTAATDAITGLPNHRALMSRLEEELAHCRRADRSCAILFIDIDHFKRVNDTWGHRAGDAILREIGARLCLAQQVRKRVRSAVSVGQGSRHYGHYTHPPNFLSNARSTLRKEDFVGRYGGEEFAIILPDAGLSGARVVAERLRVAVAKQPCFWEAEGGQSAVPISMTVSIGVAVYQLHGVTREALVESADRAMYRAKQSGRNCIRMAEVEESEPLQEIQPVLDAKQRVHTLEAGTVRALTTAASAHDQGTDAHAHRLVHLAVATARELGRSEEELHLIRLAALLHDIGKISIPDAILHKPGPLTDEEWAIMRRHPQVSCEILEQAGGIFHLLAHIVVAHHERWDGRGYPNGLAQETIPIGARIISVVDSYDAMTSCRVYREPLTIEQAKEELRRCAGSQYDPQVVAAFLHILDEQEQGMLPPERTGPAHFTATEQAAPLTYR
jgi:HD-GYP domain-containing protein (c-di-GMP phosphodiesterase class II)